MKVFFWAQGEKQLKPKSPKKIFFYSKFDRNPQIFPIKNKKIMNMKHPVKKLN